MGLFLIHSGARYPLVPPRTVFVWLCFQTKLCQPKITDASIELIIQKYILCLYITVDDLCAALVMQIQEPPCNP